jgi:hypothetical protein
MYLMDSTGCRNFRQSDIFSYSAMASGLKRFAAFVTHDWGTDEQGRDNHRRVVAVAHALTAQGLPVWIDEVEMKGDVVMQMCNGIENSDVALVFVTARYVKKVQIKDDNCNLEFMHAIRMMGRAAMIPVIMDKRMSNKRRWTGPFGMQLAGHIHVKMWDDDDITGAGLESLISSIVKAVPAWKQHVKQVPSPAGRPKHQQLSLSGPPSSSERGRSVLGLLFQTGLTTPARGAGSKSQGQRPTPAVNYVLQRADLLASVDNRNFRVTMQQQSRVQYLTSLQDYLSKDPKQEEVVVSHESALIWSIAIMMCMIGGVA